MLKVLGRDNSNNVKKVLWCAAELELEFERVDYGGVHGGLDSDEYRKLNPNGLIPCLIDGERSVWESNAIVRYLVAAYGNGALQSGSPLQRAICDQWMDWVLSMLAAPFRDLFFNRVCATPEQFDADAMARGQLLVAERLAIVDRALASQAWLSGDAFGMGDIPMGCFVHTWFAMDIERPTLPHLADWHARLETRPAFRQHVMTPLT